MKRLLSLLLILVLTLLPASNTLASHDGTLPLVCETFESWPLRVRLCAWDKKPHYEPERVQAILRAVVEGANLIVPLWISVTIAESRTLDKGIWGFYDPGSRTIFIAPDATHTPPDYKFYYTLAHEILHAVYDRWHVSWDDQHCRMYKTDSELEPARALIRSWNPDAKFENPFAVMFSCRQGAEE